MTEQQYPKADRPANPAEAEAVLDELNGLADRAGVSIPALADAREAIDRTRDFRREQRARRENRSDAIRRISRQIADGELSLDDAADEAVRVEAWAPAGLLDASIALAEDSAARRALAAAGRKIDGDLVFNQCRKIAAEIVSEIKELRKQLDSICDAEGATRGGPAKAKAWATYRTELLPRWVAAHGLVKRMRELHWLNPLPVDLAQFARFGRPDLRREDYAAARRGRRELLELLDPVSDRWKPGGPHTEKEAAAFAKATEAERAPEPNPSAGIRTSSRSPFR